LQRTAPHLGGSRVGDSWWTDREAVDSELVNSLPGFQVKVLITLEVVLSSLGSDCMGGYASVPKPRGERESMAVPGAFAGTAAVRYDVADEAIA